MAWVDVNERLPANTDFVKYEVKMLVGSFEVHEMSGVALGKVYPGGDFRFVSGDWHTVTHWWED